MEENAAASGKVRSYLRWTPREEAELLSAVEKHGRSNWEFLSEAPEYPLLSCRSATMLKNKFYKLLRAEQGLSPSGDKKIGKSKGLSVDTSRCNSVSLDRCASMESVECMTPPQSPQKKARQSSIVAGWNLRPLANPPERSTPTQSATTARLNEAAAMLKEALAIQVDANKAVAACIEARDNGQGDDETVRTALHVASLAHEKARKARQIVTLARQEHATQILQEETTDDVTMEGNMSLSIADGKAQVPQAGIKGKSTTTVRADVQQPEPNGAPETYASFTGLDSALLEACNFIVDHEWPPLPDFPLEKHSRELDQGVGNLDGLACCKHHADMFGLSPPTDLLGTSMWDLASGDMEGSAADMLP
eukprot:jgi/Tetstr1/435625/TSEL_024526.t1